MFEPGQYLGAKELVQKYGKKVEPNPMPSDALYNIVLALCFLNHYTSEGTKQGPVMIYDLQILLNNTSPYLANHVEE
jgi:hypothetical protein